MTVKNIVQGYLLDFDEIARLGLISYLTAVQKTEGLSRQERVRKETELIVDDLLSLLILAYKQGSEATGVMLGFAPKVSARDMERAIYQEIAGETFVDRMRNHVEQGDPGLLKNLEESEVHRVYTQGAEDAARQADRPVVKTWVTMGDPRVRDTHAHLDGNTVGLEDEFYTFDGDHAQRPGGFTLASNNVNCRCWLQYRYA